MVEGYARRGMPAFARPALLHHPADGASRWGGLCAETAYAKINLALHVRRRRDDGYHELETLFAFVDAGDVLTARAPQPPTACMSPANSPPR